MKLNLELSIIIPSFNTKKLLYNCLKSIFSQTKKIKFEVIVVDNASVDGSVQMIKKEFPQVKLIRNKKNLGYAKANNQGINLAKGKYILLLNSDTKIINEAIEKMVDWLELHPKIGIAGCQLLNSDGSIQPSAGFLPRLSKIFSWALFLDDLPLIWRIIKPYQVSKKIFYQNSHLNLGWVTGAFLIIKRRVIEKVGLVDERFFMYAEDVDWCYMAKEKGWQIGFNSEAQIVHYKGKSSKSGFKAAVLGEYKGLLAFFTKHKPSWEMPILKVLLKIGALLRFTIFGVIMNNKTKRRVYEKAFKVVR